MTPKEWRILCLRETGASIGMMMYFCALRKNTSFSLVTLTASLNSLIVVYSRLYCFPECAVHAVVGYISEPCVDRNGEFAEMSAHERSQYF